MNKARIEELASGIVTGMHSPELKRAIHSAKFSVYDDYRAWRDE